MVSFSFNNVLLRQRTSIFTFASECECESARLALQARSQQNSIMAYAHFQSRIQPCTSLLRADRSSSPSASQILLCSLLAIRREHVTTRTAAQRPIALATYSRHSSLHTKVWNECRLAEIHHLKTSHLTYFTFINIAHWYPLRSVDIHTFWGDWMYFLSARQCHWCMEKLFLIYDAAFSTTKLCITCMCLAEHKFVLLFTRMELFG